MIYFLINNNYHFELVVRLANELTDYKLGLLQVPYSLDVISSHHLFRKIVIFDERIHTSLKRLVLKPAAITDVKKKIDQNIVVNETDILFVHTELDLINQCIIQKFYERQARVFLLEDGTSTMGAYNLPMSKADLGYRIKSVILKKAYNFKYTSYGKFGNQTLPIMRDSIFAGSIVNYGYSIRRNIPLYRLRQHQVNLRLDHDQGALFLSQALYFWYSSEEQYIEFLNRILIVSEKFSPFYLKFHPSEKESVKRSIELLVKNKYPNISIVKEAVIAEKLVEKLRVKYVITVNSSAALNLISKGVVPIFLNKLFCEDHSSSEGREFLSFLNSINCNYPTTLTEIKPGFVAMEPATEDQKSYTIKEILSLK